MSRETDMGEKKKKMKVTNSWGIYDIYKHITHRLMVNAETDEIFSHRIMFKDNIRFFKQLSNNLNFYTFSSYSIIEKYEKNNTIKYIDYVGSQVYNDNSILIAIKTSSSVLFKDDINLYLIKEPYKKISKCITIFSEIPHLSYKLLL